MRGRMARRGWMLVGLFALLSAACGPPWVVITAAIPNPFVGAHQFTLEPFHFEDLVVGEKIEKKYLAEKDDEQKKRWEDDKQTFSKTFADTLVAALPEVRFGKPEEKAPFLVRPRAVFIEPGFYAVTAARPTEVRVTIEVLNDQNEVIEIVNLKTSVPGTLNNPSTGERLKAAAETLGEHTAAYLRSRVFP